GPPRVPCPVRLAPCLGLANRLGLVESAIAASLIVVPATLANDAARVVVAVVRLDGHERPAIPELLVVVLRLVLGDPEPDERAGDTAGHCAGDGTGRGARERGGEKSAGNDRPDAGHEQGSG